MDFNLSAFLCALAVVLLWIINKRPKNFPPGPTKWLLVGSIPSMIPKNGETPFDGMSRMQKQFGDIIGIFFGPLPAVVVNGYEAVKKISAMEEFSFRPQVTLTQHGKIGGSKRLGILFAEGDRWKSQRRFTLRHLRDFGFGRQGMQEYIQEEARMLLSAFDRLLAKQGSDGVDVLALLPAAAINTLWCIVAGVRYGLDDEDFSRLTQAVLRFFRLTKTVTPVGFYRPLQYIPIINRNFLDQQACGDLLWDFVQRAVKEHLRTYEDDHMRDFIDVYIREMRQQPEGYFSEDQLTAACVDLFLAGTETSSGVLSFTLRYMLWHPEIQDKFRKEIFDVVGTERLITLEDKNKLPYCSAVLSESMRHSGILPFAPPRANAEASVFGGFSIPKRSLILINLRSVHMDPGHWGDPENFRPERFIDSEGKFIKDDHMISFGTGMRSCLGESFARNSTFVLLASMMQKYKVEVPDDGSAPVDVTHPGATAAPEHFRVKLTKL